MVHYTISNMFISFCGIICLCVGVLSNNSPTTLETEDHITIPTPESNTVLAGVIFREAVENALIKVSDDYENADPRSWDLSSTKGDCLIVQNVKTALANIQYENSGSKYTMENLVPKLMKYIANNPEAPEGKHNFVRSKNSVKSEASKRPTNENQKTRSTTTHVGGTMGKAEKKVNLFTDISTLAGKLAVMLLSPVILLVIFIRWCIRKRAVIAAIRVPKQSEHGTSNAPEDAQTVVVPLQNDGINETSATPLPSSTPSTINPSSDRSAAALALSTPDSMLPLIIPHKSPRTLERQVKKLAMKLIVEKNVIRLAERKEIRERIQKLQLSLSEDVKN